MSDTTNTCVTNHVVYQSPTDYTRIRAVDCRTGKIIVEDADAASVIQTCLDLGAGTYIDKGYYKILRPLLIKKSNTVIIGSGGLTTFDFDGSSFPCLFANNPSDLTTKTFCHFEKIRIDNNATPGSGTAFDMSYFVICSLRDIWMNGVNCGIEFTGIGSNLYNKVDNVRIAIKGQGSCAIAIREKANQNSIRTARILPDSSDPVSTGIMNNGSGTELDGIDVEILANIGIDLGPTSSAVTIKNCWLEQNYTNVRIQEGASGTTFIGGVIEDAFNTNIDDQNGSDTTAFIELRLQYKYITKINGIIFPSANNGQTMDLNNSNTINARIKGRQEFHSPLLTDIQKGFYEVYEDLNTGDCRLVYHSIFGDCLKSISLR